MVKCREFNIWRHNGINQKVSYSVNNDYIKIDLFKINKNILDFYLFLCYICFNYYQSNLKVKMSIFETENSTIGHQTFVLDANKVLNSPIFTDKLLQEVNEKATCHEDIFSNSVTHALYQEYLTQTSLLHNIAEKLCDVLQSGYTLNLNHEQFIKNIILFFQYGKGDIFSKVFNQLPDVLKVFIAYHQTTQKPIHFWFESLMAELSVSDLMNCFNVTPSQPCNIQQDRLALEPYLIALDAFLQKFDFDTGHEHKIELVTYTLKLRSVYNYLNASHILSEKDKRKFSEIFPEKYQFLIECALSLDCGNFLNGLVTLSEMVFGGPSSKFIKRVVNLLFETQAYTLPFSNHGIPLPECLPFPRPQKIFFYTPFVFSKDKDTNKTLN